MTRTLAAGVLLLVAACQSTTADPRSLENENRNLEGVVEQQQQRIDDLTAEKVDLDRRVKELEARVGKLKRTEDVVEEAKDEISEHVRQVLAKFRGDTDIEVERAEGGYRFVLREAVLFETASADLTQEGRRALQRVADALSGGNEKISIEGHTDDVPVAKEETLKKFPRGNMDLAAQRALSVWEFLVTQGRVARSRASIAGFGEHRPRVPNTSESNRWRNRRVEILVQE